MMMMWKSQPLCKRTPRRYFATEFSERGTPLYVGGWWFSMHTPIRTDGQTNGRGCAFPFLCSGVSSVETGIHHHVPSSRYDGKWITLGWDYGRPQTRSLNSLTHFGWKIDVIWVVLLWDTEMCRNISCFSLVLFFEEPSVNVNWIAFTTMAPFPMRYNSSGLRKGVLLFRIIMVA